MAHRRKAKSEQNNLEKKEDGDFLTNESNSNLQVQDECSADSTDDENDRSKENMSTLSVECQKDDSLSKPKETEKQIEVTILDQALSNMQEDINFKESSESETQNADALPNSNSLSQEELSLLSSLGIHVSVWMFVLT